MLIMLARGHNLSVIFIFLNLHSSDSVFLFPGIVLEHDIYVCKSASRCALGNTAVRDSFLLKGLPGLHFSLL